MYIFTCEGSEQDNLQWIILNLNMTFPSCHRTVTLPSGKLARGLRSSPLGPSSSSTSLPGCGCGLRKIVERICLLYFLAMMWLFWLITKLSAAPPGRMVLKFRKIKKSSILVCWAQSIMTEPFLILSSVAHSYGLESAASCPNQIDQANQADLLPVPGSDERRLIPSTGHTHDSCWLCWYKDLITQANS